MPLFTHLPLWPLQLSIPSPHLRFSLLCCSGNMCDMYQFLSLFQNGWNIYKNLWCILHEISLCRFMWWVFIAFESCRMEKVNIRTKCGVTKIASVFLCLVGVATLAFYKGPQLRIAHHHYYNHHEDHFSSTKRWVLGSLLLFLSVIIWSLWLVIQVHPLVLHIFLIFQLMFYKFMYTHIILFFVVGSLYLWSQKEQAQILKSYPAKLKFTSLQCLSSSIQSFCIAIAFERDIEQWKLGWDMKLLAVVYCVSIKNCDI